jgi:hypothetical protein
MRNSPRRVAFYERNQYFLRSAYRAVHDPAAPLDAQAETTDHRVSITKDVPVLRIDHISTKSPLLGVWRGKRLRAVGDPIVANRCFVHVPLTVFREGQE